MKSYDPLDEMLFDISGCDPISHRDAFEGVQIFGGIGSGKTTGSGAKFARAFINAGYGGLVLTAKIDETEQWKKYAKEFGREDDLIIIDPSASYRFNFLDYEQNNPDADAGLTENIVYMLEAISDVAGSEQSAQQRDGKFWTNEFRKLVRNSVELLTLSGERISLSKIKEIVLSAARNPDQIQNSEWRKSSKCFLRVVYAKEREEDGELTVSQKNDLQQTYDFWMLEYPQKPEKTRGTIESIFSGVCDVFLRGFLHEVFGTTTNVTPEDSGVGKIIILDFPQKKYHEIGVLAQVLFKLAWQRAMERRKVELFTMPCFLWMDESQFFINKHDVSFQTTARSARIATVLLTQNLPNYYAALGGTAASKDLVDSLLGNLTTKIFHNNTCAQTNVYAANLFAKDWQSIPSSSYSHGQEIGFTVSEGLQMADTVLPREFTGLLKGGPKNEFFVEGIVHQGGKIFNLSGANALKTVFPQT